MPSRFNCGDCILFTGQGCGVTHTGIIEIILYIQGEYYYQIEIQFNKEVCKTHVYKEVQLTGCRVIV